MTKIKSKIKRTIRRKKKVTEEFEEEVAQEVTRKEVDPDTLIPSGCTTFDLECSGRTEGGFQMGKMVNLIGDSHAGKTLFALTIFAECALDERFEDVRFIYDDVEAANEFDIPYLFGQVVDDRIEDDGNDRSRTIEDFMDNVARALEEEERFIYVLDSFDALTSNAEIEKSIKNRAKREKGQKADGSYGDGKAKIASEFFRLNMQNLKDHGSAIIIVSQTRDNIGFGAMFTPKTRSGGRALKFYASHEVWLACQKKEKKGKRTLVTNVQAKITKNKITGRHGEAYFPVLFDYGIDNLNACITFLKDEGDWTGTASSLNTKGFYPDGKISKSKLIKWIETHEMEDDLKQLCQEAYDELMESLRPNRRRRY